MQRYRDLKLKLLPSAYRSYIIFVEKQKIAVFLNLYLNFSENINTSYIYHKLEYNEGEILKFDFINAWTNPA